MTTATAVLVGGVLIVLGVVLIRFRVPIAAFFREARERQGSRNAASQTPGLMLAGGVFLVALGLFLAVGALTGSIHPH